MLYEKGKKHALRGHKTAQNANSGRVMTDFSGVGHKLKAPETQRPPAYDSVYFQA